MAVREPELSFNATSSEGIIFEGAGPSDWIGETVPMKKPAQRLIAEVPRRHAKVELTIGIDLGDIWSHYCTLNEDGEVFDRGAFEPAHPASTNGLPTCLGCASPWKPELIPSGSASRYAIWAMK
jgi:hypothetical protein